mmetsp:Transcript_15441/g.32503  ORF Transcript_15441/g.32503 Transcript_15441/m.32503 type:complete len:462 (-) Transcript_15441:486-1871(-)
MHHLEQLQALEGEVLLKRCDGPPGALGFAFRVQAPCLLQASAFLIHEPVRLLKFATALGCGGLNRPIAKAIALQQLICLEDAAEDTGSIFQFLLQSSMGRIDNNPPSAQASNNQLPRRFCKLLLQCLEDPLPGLRGAIQIMSCARIYDLLVPNTQEGGQQGVVGAGNQAQGVGHTAIFPCPGQTLATGSSMPPFDTRSQQHAPSVAERLLHGGQNPLPAPSLELFVEAAGENFPLPGDHRPLPSSEDVALESFLRVGNGAECEGSLLLLCSLALPRGHHYILPSTEDLPEASPSDHRRLEATVQGCCPAVSGGPPGQAQAPLGLELRPPCAADTTPSAKASHTQCRLIIGDQGHSALHLPSTSLGGVHDVPPHKHAPHQDLLIGSIQSDLTLFQCLVASRPHRHLGPFVQTHLFLQLTEELGDPSLQMSDAERCGFLRFENVVTELHVAMQESSVKELPQV